jgi:hypothetical protein
MVVDLHNLIRLERGCLNDSDRRSHDKEAEGDEQTTGTNQSPYELIQG